jgi:predicted nucleic acid-binding protein
MIVVDSSALVEALAYDNEALRTDLAHDDLHTSQHLEVEVASALRRLEAAGEVTEGLSEIALAALVRLEVRQHRTAPLLERIWQLRHNVTPYDAAYVALAEQLGCRLLTKDARLAAAPGIRCEVELLTS